jgi:hypothetical protein
MSLLFLLKDLPKLVREIPKMGLRITGMKLCPVASVVSAVKTERKKEVLWPLFPGTIEWDPLVPPDAVGVQVGGWGLLSRGGARAAALRVGKCQRQWPTAALPITQRHLVTLIDALQDHFPHRPSLVTEDLDVLLPELRARALWWDGASSCYLTLEADKAETGWPPTCCLPVKLETVLADPHDPLTVAAWVRHLQGAYISPFSSDACLDTLPKGWDPQTEGARTLALMDAL